MRINLDISQGRATTLVIAGAVLMLTAGSLSMVVLSREDEPAAAGSPTSAEGRQAGKPDREVNLSAVGDVIMGSLPDKLPPDPKQYFDGVDSELNGDIVFGNLEGALSKKDSSNKCGEADDNKDKDKDKGKGKKKDKEEDSCLYVRMPPKYAEVLADSGFTLLNNANNHANDAGESGREQSREAISAAGMTYSGVRGEIAEVEVDGVTVAMVSAATYDYYNDVRDVDAVAELVSAAEAQADLVLFSMHAGGEGKKYRHVTGDTEKFYGEDRGDPAALSHAVVDAGADLVLGHGPHVLRGMEFYKGRLVAHSLGNFSGYGVLTTSGANGRGGILRVKLGADGQWRDGEFVSTIMDGSGIPTIDDKHAALEDITELSADDFDKTAAQVSRTGQIAPPE